MIYRKLGQRLEVLCQQCHNCNRIALRTSINIPRASITVKPSIVQAIPTTSHRFATYGPNCSASSPSKDESSKEPELRPPEDHGHLAEQDEVSKPASELPWYLQVKIPQRIESPLFERQKLPDLPPDPPPLMQPLLEHMSIDLGLDDLSLLDLRDLDPPPALGSKLMMVICTARSEKHLHVSADRLCRWLRSAHKLSPYADGLLGRGELRLKLKRRARRAKILSRVRSTSTSSMDDGLRTGWVCVNVGIVEDGVEHKRHSSAVQGYVGFGDDNEAARIVVQMLTEEKREELDLEKLWKQAIARQERREIKVLQEQEELPEALAAQMEAVSTPEATKSTAPST